MAIDALEVLAMLGSPARLLGRVLLYMKYAFSFRTTIQHWKHHEYSRRRFGKRYNWRPWLLWDAGKLEQLEYLINDGTDEQVLVLRTSKLDTFSLVAVTGALLSQATISALNLPKLEEVHYTARGLLTTSLLTSLLAVYFTCVQQRALTFVQTPLETRLWLTNGIRDKNTDGQGVFQSSYSAYQLLELPYELIGISITLFLAGFGTYLGSAFASQVALNVAEWKGEGNVGVLGAYMAVLIAVCTIFGAIVGGKNVEKARKEEIRLEMADCRGAARSRDSTAVVVPRRSTY